MRASRAPSPGARPAANATRWRAVYEDKAGECDRSAQVIRDLLHLSRLARSHAP